MTSLIGQAETLTLLGLIDAVAARLGIQELDGLPLVDWYLRQRQRELRRALERLEDLSPAIAAVLQQRVDEASSG